jgi:hypothetical protein
LFTARATTEYDRCAVVFNLGHWEGMLMNVDRYTKVVLTIIAMALMTLAVRPWVESGLAILRPGTAQAQTIAPKHEVMVPKVWGKMINFSNGNLLLQDTEGNLRIVDVDGKAPEYPKIKTLIRWQH